ncbi:DUF983 domain-containing protein [Rubellimicrobium aerolatum]|uniref:DUF983 domain-containing protein n=1 Tax=Rubellimicrobium aerolatum TaxID=490979 RepID=A0ABW0SB32_9RHOB|nr:DUF983 domain-containing protein [Rubellimicrobium aerolatum]MBP1805366.1 uncharacterized protein (DUF983 family) [Rubellimicrobium aerolatum]
MDDPATTATADRIIAVPQDRPVWTAVRRGVLRRCPHCGEGRLFDGYLKVADCCASCGEVLRHHRADDGPAYLTILVVGHLIAFLMHFVWVTFRPEPLVFATILTVFAVGLSLWLLPRFKGAIVGYQWAHRMHGFDDGR